MCATATASRRSDGKYSATISPAARSSPSPPWPSPKPRSKFRVTPSSAASSFGATEGHAPHRWAVNWLRYGCAIAAVAAAGAFGALTRALAQDYPTRPLPLAGVAAARGPLDVAPRVPPPDVGKALGQRIVIENNPRGRGELRAASIAKDP